MIQDNSKYLILSWNSFVNCIVNSFDFEYSMESSVAHRATLLVNTFFAKMLGILTTQGQKDLYQDLYLYQLNLVYVRSIKLSLREVRLSHQSEQCHSLMFSYCN